MKNIPTSSKKIHHLSLFKLKNRPITLPNTWKGEHLPQIHIQRQKYDPFHDEIAPLAVKNRLFETSNTLSNTWKGEKLYLKTKKMILFNTFHDENPTFKLKNRLFEVYFVLKRTHLLQKCPFSRSKTHTYHVKRHVSQ